ncbi:uncharacterized protein LOC108038205 [Drosophila rhopaloa]|uniref:Uncharacterized protein LOC108038205 n=1 Tax=Drosophila rhopaloa TaxID=1041015 RepID=A0A6P4DXL8_DRORH|nr:uncharacterized protein LOC108038205 [Drosophila rhopaloa]
MRFLVVYALAAFLAISVVTAFFPSTVSGSDQGNSSDQPVIRPIPWWPRWGGIGPVVLNTAPTKAST